MTLSKRQIEIVQKLGRNWKGRLEAEYEKLHPRSKATIKHMILRRLIERVDDASDPSVKRLNVTIVGAKELELTMLNLERAKRFHHWGKR